MGVLKTCSVEGCENRFRCKGFCNAHYRRFLRLGDPLASGKTISDPRERFWSKVKQGDGCWEWQGSLHRGGGYGIFPIPDGKQGRSYVLAHRYSARLHFADFEESRTVCHHCDNPKCVRPDHLFLGDQFDNMRDASNKGRLNNQRKTQCKRGHDFSPDNTYIDPAGRRTCRTCMRMHQARWREARRTAS